MSLLAFNIKDTASPALFSLIQGLEKRRPLHAALGKKAEVELRDHFARRDAEPNSRGWKALHFWGRMRTATSLRDINEDGARVVVADPAMNQKVYGGTITAKEGKFLAIPARQEAYGKSPRMFDDLYFVALSGGRGMLVQTAQTALIRFKSGKRKGEVKSTEERGGGVFYWLVKSVTQAPDPKALPEPESFRAALLATAQEYIDGLVAK